MSYFIPMQIHVIWHPDSDALCRPFADKLYVALNRDAYQPLVPGIGIPVFFRCAGADARAPNGPPAPIVVPDTEYDLRIELRTPELVLDSAWSDYVDANAREVAGKRKQATFMSIALDQSIADGDTKIVVV